jgi:phospholipase C
VTATFNGPSLASIQHIVFMLQENRSFDNYFGALRDYWAKNGYSDQSFDGLPQFNPTTGTAPLRGAAPSNPGCDPASQPPNDCVFDTANGVSSYHLLTMCTENTSPAWDEAHVVWNFNDQVGKYPATLNGFVWTAGHDARYEGYYDTNGVRAMGYYDGGDLNYYYYMASNFATSDRWFSPVMSRTAINREYLIGATSQGRAYPNGTTLADQPQITAETIFEAMTNAGISWKIYVNPLTSNCTAPYTASCLITLTYLQFFKFAQVVVAKYPQNLATMSQYYDDLKNNTLPQVAMIESLPGYDEHGSDLDTSPINIQLGAQYASTIINSLMNSTSWSSSAFIFTFDEFGGLYDHVSPQHAVSPDGIAPMDLQPGDVCTTILGPTCDFIFTGYRVPLIVVSPFAKKHYVSHTVTDYTAILKLIETRFNLPALTKRDAAQMDMTEFFDFSNPQWLVPPIPPLQNTNGACYLDHLP